jgi:hypothetical protein
MTQCCQIGLHSADWAPELTRLAPENASRLLGANWATEWERDEPIGLPMISAVLELFGAVPELFRAVLEILEPFWRRFELSQSCLTSGSFGQKIGLGSFRLHWKVESALSHKQNLATLPYDHTLHVLVYVSSLYLLRLCPEPSRGQCGCGCYALKCHERVHNTRFSLNVRCAQHVTFSFFIRARDKASLQC